MMKDFLKQEKRQHLILHKLNRLCLSLLSARLLANRSTYLYAGIVGLKGCKQRLFIATEMKQAYFGNLRKIYNILLC